MLASIQQLSFLQGHEIIRWIGTEMAVNRKSNTWSESESQWKLEHGQVEWSNSSIPYLQFTDIDIQLANGTAIRLLSQFDDRNGFYGLYFIEIDEISEPCIGEEWSIFCRRDIPELPLGLARIEVLRKDGTNIIEASIFIAASTIRLLSAEIHPCMNDEFDIVECDESILIQLNEEKPAPT